MFGKRFVSWENKRQMAQLRKKLWGETPQLSSSPTHKHAAHVHSQATPNWCNLYDTWYMSIAYTGLKVKCRFNSSSWTISTSKRMHSLPGWIAAHYPGVFIVTISSTVRFIFCNVANATVPEHKERYWQIFLRWRHITKPAELINVIMIAFGVGIVVKTMSKHVLKASASISQKFLR